MRNLVATSTTTAEQAAGLRVQMPRFFPKALVTDYEVLIDAMPNDEKDRHVAAAAVKAGAQVIVTNNLKDFRSLPENGIGDLTLHPRPGAPDERPAGGVAA